MKIIFFVFQEEDATLSAEDLQKKIERLTKLSRKKSEDFTFVNNTLRASDLGQDRFRLVSPGDVDIRLINVFVFQTSVLASGACWRDICRGPRVLGTMETVNQRPQ